MFSESICKVLVNLGVCSERGARTILKQGRVSVDGVVVKEHDYAVDAENSLLSLDGFPLPRQKHFYIMLNKPLGYVCSSASDRHPVIYSLLSSIEIPHNQTLHSAGRLDAETSGLLLLTTNGAFSHFLTAPESHVKKQYSVTLEKPVNTQEQLHYIKLFAEGTILPAEKKAPESTALPADLQFVSQTECVVTVSEGKFHQVRRMFLGVGNKVQGLHRISIGGLKLDPELLPGEFKFLSEDDFEKLQI